MPPNSSLEPKPAMTLIVYDQNPEKLSFYLVESGSVIARLVHSVANKYLGGDKLTYEEDKAFVQLTDWAESADGKAAEVQLPLKAKIREVIRFGIFC